MMYDGNGHSIYGHAGQRFMLKSKMKWFKAKQAAINRFHVNNESKDRRRSKMVEKWQIAK